jgi:hypothetical protein
MLALVLGASVVPATHTLADVLVSAPDSSVCQDRQFTVGVWYQSYSERWATHLPGGCLLSQRSASVARARQGEG